MKMLRHYCISDDLDDLEAIEEQLESAGVSTPQIHVLTAHDAELDHHEHLHRVQSFMKKDVIHSTVIGAAIGVVRFHSGARGRAPCRLDRYGCRLGAVHLPGHQSRARFSDMGGRVVGHP